jgi:hypothetical protein
MSNEKLHRWLCYNYVVVDNEFEYSTLYKIIDKRVGIVCTDMSIDARFPLELGFYTAGPKRLGLVSRKWLGQAYAHLLFTDFIRMLQNDKR